MQITLIQKVANSKSLQSKVSGSKCGITASPFSLIKITIIPKWPFRKSYKAHRDLSALTPLILEDTSLLVCNLHAVIMVESK